MPIVLRADQAVIWNAVFGAPFTGLGSAGTNTVKWSVRTVADAQYSTYDWTANVLELAGNRGHYVVDGPTLPDGRYLIRARTADSGGEYLTEEIIVGPSQAALVQAVWDALTADLTTNGSIGKRLAALPLDPADASDIAALFATAQASLDTLTSRLTAARATRIDSIPTIR